MRAWMWLLLFLSTSAFSGIFEKQCVFAGVQLRQHEVNLFTRHNVKLRLYAINNVSSQYDIWLTHHNPKNPGVGAGWDTHLLSGHWSVLLVTHRRFTLYCHRQNSEGEMQRTSCRRHLRVCQYKSFTTQNPALSGYWVLENEHFSSLPSHLIARGFYIH
ncbi:MAG: hypothetical protein ACD_70C00209G0002 [uncultured bacterium]|nr:MAG: hypothetical protein ACD_70C00209G0002 [uncultured bacterium]OGT25139.1 MAG: hypothetical protein A3B71_00210 [Gammaproteobacteria bacterium RIFCSPHIGHO2_02_FULL_42_43]